MAQLLSTILLAIAVAGAAYLALAIVQLLRFTMRPLELAEEFLPSITVLKPVAGAEPHLYENLASFCDQEYDAPYDVVFCLQSADDAALPVVRAVVARFASCSTSVAIGEASGILNPKIANIAKPGVELRGEIVVVADSDIAVGRDYLRAIVSAFASQRAGAATCLYSGTPGDKGIVSRLGALQIDDGFFPSVLVALALGKLRFCVGATMAVRRRILEEIGGLRALGNHLADDHALGELVAGRGYGIELSRYVVNTAVNETTLSQLWAHELRWARTNFALAPIGYAFSFLMYALPFALLYCVASQNVGLGLPLLGTVALLRLALHYLARRALSVRRNADAWLILIRDCLSLSVWAASLFGRAVKWRNRWYTAGR